MVKDLNERSREIFRLIVDTFLETGEPVGSRTLSQRLSQNLSPATIRSVMADLEELNLLTAPHVSAGRIPTEAGLRLFVDGILEVGALSDNERRELETRTRASGKNLPQMLEELTATLSGLSACAGLVVVPKAEERALKQIEFVSLAPDRALVVLVSEGGLVENRVVELPAGVPASALTLASNFLNAHLSGKNLSTARQAVQEEIKRKKHELDGITTRLVETGLAIWSGDQAGGYLIVRGQSQLLNNVQAVADLDRVRHLFEALETRETMLRLLDATTSAEGVQIFIGAENRLFAGSGCSMIVSPYVNGQEKVVGAIGVVGPVRMNYARIIPMVDYTARLISKMVN
ncbi:MAG: heat-inducible transcriptional repressor HrcA [Proteobacteria bacterium]|nr:heat-inducible transcriptional repressor HrcA [Pseudomonadota bacterium]